MSRIYLDYAATTPLDKTVLEKMMPYFSEKFGNPSSLYREGQYGREAIDDARFTIAKTLECNLDEIIFTSGATESNNLAIKGVIEAWRKNNPEKIPEIIASPIEHSSVKNVLEYLQENFLANIKYCSVNQEGIIDPEEIKTLITENTALVTVMAVNNEIGSIQPISRIGRLCEKNNIPFHVDAVQAMGQIKTAPVYFKCDLLSLSAHKIYGPKGIGILYVKTGTEICEQIRGGGQERNYRSGTENVPAIVGHAAAIEHSEARREEEFFRLQKLQKIGKKFLEENFSGHLEWKWNGPNPEAKDENENWKRASNNLHFSLNEIDGESLLMRLDLEGISVSLGSACSAGMMSPSHVLIAIGCTEEEAQTGIRITMGRETTEKKLITALEKILEIGKNLKENQGFFG
jgi:cysteine desulfurase